MGMARLLSKDQTYIISPTGEKSYKCNECVKFLSDVQMFTLGVMREFASERKHTNVLKVARPLDNDLISKFTKEFIL